MRRLMWPDRLCYLVENNNATLLAYLWAMKNIPYRAIRYRIKDRICGGCKNGARVL